MNKIFQFFYISLILIMVTTCSDVGVFYSLENEVKVADKNNLNDAAQFENMVDTNPLTDLDPLDDTGYYIGNAGMTVYYRSKTESYNNWSKLAVPTSGFASDATTSSMVLIGTDLYISRISKDGSNFVSGIYRLNLVAYDLTSAVSSDWDVIEFDNTGIETSYKYYKLFNASTSLYVNELTKNDDSDGNNVNITDSKVYQKDSPGADDLSTFTPITTNIDIGSTDEVKKVIHDSASDNYWLIYNDKDGENGYVYIDEDTADFDDNDPILTLSGAMLVDIFYYTDSTSTLTDYILISDNDEHIYTFTGATSPTQGTISVSDADIECNFNGFANIEDLTSDYMVIVGTTIGEGYFQINMDTLAIDEDYQFASNYSSSDLSDASILGFLMDDQNDRLFAYTSGDGVWLNISDEWTHE